MATDIAARGIDVSEISHVINYDMPDTVDAYTHRIGRTGRAEKNGQAFTIAVPDDADMVRQIEKVLKRGIEKRSLPDFDYGGFKPEVQFVQQVQIQHQRNSKNNGKERQRRSQRSKNYNSQHRQTS